MRQPPDRDARTLNQHDQCRIEPIQLALFPFHEPTPPPWRAPESSIWRDDEPESDFGPDQDVQF